MGLFDVTDEKLQAFYHRAWLECNRGFVDPRKYPYLDKVIFIYAKEHECSYDEALIFAKTGKKMGRITLLWKKWLTTAGIRRHVLS